MKWAVLSFLLITGLILQAQYDFRVIPRKANEEYFFHGNRALDDGSYVAVGIVENDSLATSELILIKWNCLGEVEWAKRLGASIKVNNTYGNIVQAENGDIVMSYNLATGWFTASMLVARFTLEGDLVWAKRLGISEEYARDIVATDDGGFVVAGSTGTFGVDVQRADIYLIKLDADGNVEWTRTYGNPDAYDDAYGLSLAENGDLLVTGRYIVGGTFYGFFLRADDQGEPLAFKAYGQPNHRTFLFDVQETPEGDVLLSGYTTIAKVDFMSMGDACLLKVDGTGEEIYSRIYEPLESDRNDFAFSIVIEDDGDYGLALESSSFQAIGGPQAPNKNVIYSVTQDGWIKFVQLFNPKGSQYTNMTKAPDGGYFVTGFSTYYGGNVTFEGFAFKTDANYYSGDDCEYHDRSDKVSTLTLPWDIQDVTYSGASNHRIVDHTIVSDFTFDENFFLCTDYPEFDSQIEPPDDSYCAGDSFDLITVNAGNVNDWTWDMSNGDTLKGQDIRYAYDSAGNYLIKMTATDGCQTIRDSVEIEIQESDVTDIDTFICSGETLIFMDSMITEEGEYSFQSDTGDLCKDVIRLNVELKEDCPCDGFIPNAFTPNGDGMNDVLGMFPIEDACEPLDVDEFRLVIFNRWGQKVFESSDVQARWNGTYKGEDCPSEVYLVNCTYLLDEVPKTINQDVTLIR